MTGGADSKPARVVAGAVEVNPQAVLPLDSPLTAIPGIGPARAKALLELGIKNVAQLVNYLPVRHERQEPESTISELLPDAVVSCRGTVSATRLAGQFPRQRLEVALSDDTGRLDLVFFNGGYLRHKIQPGVRLRVQGKSKRFGHGLQLANPNYEILSPSAEPPARDGRLRPVYPASESITSKQIDDAVRCVLEAVLSQIQDHLPERVRDERELLGLDEAYRAMHSPQDEAHAAAGRRRLAYDELLLMQIALGIKRHQRQRGERAPVLTCTPAIDAGIRARFPFALTGAQDAVVREIAQDLGRTVPTNRLVQGDVGSGKTVVALYAMLLAASSRHQAALMAPTELLAEQHHASITRMLRGSGVRVELLTGSLSPAQKHTILGAIADGAVDIVIGTHALLSQGVSFKSLAVAVIDEQHRFGVHQRLALREKAGGETTPHTLVMTATPIPRTLAMTLFGDLDVSTIRELPPGRKPVTTRVVARQMLGEVWAWVRTRLDKGEQAYIVVPAIEESDDLFDHSSPDAPPAKLTSVKQIILELLADQFADKRLAPLHGQMSPSERDEVMTRFRSGQIDALVATTVIEVGVDVPNASVMVVLDAERFGLAQLHQLRGRVGRGEKRSACILVASDSTPEAAARLSAMRGVPDGFALAEKDLQIRGFGQLLGVRQSGMPPFRVVDLTRDLELLEMARRDASAWIDQPDTLTRETEKLLKRRMLKAHGPWLGLGDVA